jgi:hypothetical protein
MAEYNIDGLMRDPDFQSKPWNERHAIMKEADPSGYGKLSSNGQSGMLNEMKQQPWWKPGGAAAAGKPADSTPPAPPPADKPSAARRAWDKWKAVQAEPFRFAAEGVTGLANTVGKAVHGLTEELPAYLSERHKGKGVADAAEFAGRETTPYKPMESPLGPSMTGQVIGGATGGVVNKLGQLTGQPELVQGAAEFAGDVAGLYGLKPGLSAVGKVGGTVKNNLMKEGLPYTNKRRAYRAAERYQDIQKTDSPLLAQQEKQTGVESNKLFGGLNATNALGQKAHLTPGQATGNIGALRLQEHFKNTDPTFATELAYNNAALNKASLEKMQGAFGEQKELPVAMSKGEIGDAQVARLQKGKGTTQTKVSGLYDEIPGYTTDRDTFNSTGAALLKTPMVQRARKAVNNFMKYAKEEPDTVHGIVALQQSVGDEISLARMSGDRQTARVLGKLDTALDAQVAVLSEAAGKGDIMAVGEKLIIPSHIRDEIAGIDEQIAKAQTAPVSVKEQNIHLRDYLAGKGETVMQNTGVSDTMYAKSLADRLKWLEGKGKAGDYVPMGSDNTKYYRGDNSATPLKGMPDGESYFFTDRRPARLYGKVSGHSLDITNPKTIDAGGKVKGEWGNYEEAITQAKKDGHDALIVKNVVDVPSEMEEGYYSDRLSKYKSDVVIPFNVAKQVKAPKPTTNPIIDNLTARRTALQSTLDAATPAVDIAAKIANATTTAKTDLFDKYYRGAVAKVLQEGNESSGLRMTSEQVPSKLFTPRGAKDLVESQGQIAAAEMSMPHVVEQLVSRHVKKGVMDVEGAAKWLADNKSALKTLGLEEPARNLVKGQFGRDIEETLYPGGLAKRADKMKNPMLTAQEAHRVIVKKYGYAAKTLFGAKWEQELKNYAHRMEIIGRDAKGALDAVKPDLFMTLAEQALHLAAVTSGVGWKYSASKNLVQAIGDRVLGVSTEQVSTIMKQALLDPEKAAVLNEIMSGEKVSPKIMRQVFGDFSKAAGAGVVSGAMQPQPSDRQEQEQP